MRKPELLYFTGDNLKVVILHHSLTKDGTVKDFDAIKKYHINTKGWDDIGYQYVIEKIGDKYYTLKGRNENSVGAHTSGHNTNTIGICVVGNFDIAAPEKGALDELTKLLDDIEQRYKGIIVMGHNEYSNKSCPGKLFPLNEFKQKYNYGDNTLRVNIFGHGILLSDVRKLDGKYFVGIRELYEKQGAKVEYINGIVYIK